MSLSRIERKNSIQAQAAVEAFFLFICFCFFYHCKNSIQAQAAVEAHYNGEFVIADIVFGKNSMQAQAAVVTFDIQHALERIILLVKTQCKPKRLL